MPSEAKPMTLTPEQLHAASTGDGIRFSENGVEFVVVRSEVYDKVKDLLEADHEELRAILARSSEASGWDEPGMDAYDSYPSRP
jgi:thermostable 8-oxoguanine DNA glycosylase